MKSYRVFAAAGAVAAIGIAIPLIAAGGPISGPIARYDMRAGTASGMAGMGGGGMGMSMMFGGGRSNQVQHELLLRLGSSSPAANGRPKADHFMPDGARLGKSVALVTPQAERTEETVPWKEPKGRILLFWGCGEHAPKGQPVVIDLSKVAKGQIPPGLYSSTILRDWGPTLTNSKTFGRWPAEDGKFVKPDSSLIGAHKIVGNYSPDIAFTLTKDFMAPLHSRTGKLPSGASLISWGGIPDATGYVATVFGSRMSSSGEMGDMVMWTSSASRQFGGGLSDWLSPRDAARLVQDRTLLSPQTTSCTLPIEVMQAAPDFRFGSLTAFGPEEDFSYPPRPAQAGVPWNLQWTARIRHRSTTSWMDAQGMMGGGMGRPGMNGGASDDGEDRGTQQHSQQPCKPKRGLGGMLGGMMGGSKGC